jgi:DNA-binding GntR family transcriptional regulator
MTLVVRTLSDQTYEVMRDRILQGAIAPGQPVRQDQIAAQLGISKIPLREALGRLEQDGLLTSYPNRGYVVRPLSAEEATEVFQLRLRLEPAAAAEACRRAAPADHELAEAELAALEAEQQQSGSGHVSRNSAFHLSLLKPGGPVAYQLIERLHLLSERYVRVHLEPQGREERARREHRAILAAWIGGDADTVENLLAAHIGETMADLQKELGPAD